VKYLVVVETTRVPIPDAATLDFVMAYVDAQQSTFAVNYSITEIKGAKTAVDVKVEED